MMQRSKQKMTTCCILLAVNIMFIWGNSLLPAEISGAFSEWIRGLLSNFFPSAENPEGGHLVRKLAHFSEFASLGFLLTWLFGMLGRTGISGAAIPLLIGFLSACADETIQIFTPGRGPSPVDVAIDTFGVSVGVGLLLLGHFISVNKHKSMEELL